MVGSYSSAEDGPGLGLGQALRSAPALQVSRAPVEAAKGDLGLGAEPGSAAGTPPSGGDQPSDGAAEESQLSRALRSSGIRWNSLMVSKLDESVQPWPLVEFLCDNFIALSAASEGVDPGGLKCDLTTGALVEMALAHLSRVPDPSFQIPAIKLTKPSPEKLPAPSPRR